MLSKRSILLFAAPTAFVILSVLPLAGQGSGDGYLKASVNPGRAGVFIDGKYMGPAANFKKARKYAVAAGEHEVKLVDPRYEDLVTKVNVTAGETTVIHETMKALPAPKPPFGRLRTPQEGDKFAAVYVNEKYMGHVDEFSSSGQALLLPPGEYTVKIVPASGAPVEKKVTIQANQTTIVK